MCLVAAIATLTLGLLAGPAAAQEEMQQWIDTTLGDLRARGDARFQWYPQRPVKGQDADFGWTNYRITGFSPVLQNHRFEWTVSGILELQDINTTAILPDIGVPFPDQLWDIRFGTGLRYLFDNGWTLGGSLTVGSPSDEPFHSIHEISVHAIAYLRVPHGLRNAWIFTLTYTTDTTFVEGIPVPGVAYHYNPSDNLSILVGLPFTSIRYQPIEALTLELTYVPIRRIRARAMYEVARPFRVWVGFDWTNDHYFRADRQDDKDELVYYEKRVVGGARFDLRHVGFELSGGYAFDRFWFEGEKYSDRNRNRIDIDAGPFLSARLSVRF